MKLKSIIRDTYIGVKRANEQASELKKAARENKKGREMRKAKKI